MPIDERAALVKLINENVGAMMAVCRGVDDKTASMAPEGRWSPKQILSHLCGPEGKGLKASVQAFLDADTPLLDITPENPYFTEARARMSIAELVAAFEQEYKSIADLTGTLSDEQLARKAHIPMLKESPLGEYPTLAIWINAIAGYHIGFHIDHMKEILQALKK